MITIKKCPRLKFSPDTWTLDGVVLHMLFYVNIYPTNTPKRMSHYVYNSFQTSLNKLEFRMFNQFFVTRHE